MENGYINSEKYPSIYSEDNDYVNISLSRLPSPFEDDQIFEEFFNKNLNFKILVKKYSKIILLVVVWIGCGYSLMVNNEKVQDMHQISIQKNAISSYIAYKNPDTDNVHIMIEGALLPAYYGNLSINSLSVWIQLLIVRRKLTSTSDIEPSDVILIQNISDVWTVPLATERLIGIVPEVKANKRFPLLLQGVHNSSYEFLRFQFKSNLKTNLPLLIGYNLNPIRADIGILFAALVLIGLYILIIFEIIHRTLAAMLASTVSLAMLAALNARPTLQEIVSWMDGETLLLLFSMMILVSILGETGVFDYLAFWAFKKSRGMVWSLIYVLCAIIIIISCILDNVTTALLITPITIKLCEVMKLNPIPILTIVMICGNIGGAITPIGDPPNVIIASNKEVLKSGVNFGTFIIHMGIGIIFCVGVVFIILRILYRDLDAFRHPECIEIQELKQNIAVLQRTAASVSSYSKNEETVKAQLLKRTVKLRDQLRITKSMSSPSSEKSLDNTLFKTQATIKNKILLIKSGFALSFVIIVLLLHSIPSLSILGMGWTSLIGALLLLLLYDNEHIEGVFARVEWCTLLFYASLFILMEALTKLGLIDYIGQQTRQLIITVNPEARLSVAIILMLWVSAIVSAFVDNLPLTTMMIKVATQLSNNADFQLPLQPLVWALSFGACLGGNGSLLGSSSNIICAGVAEQHGYKMSFVGFLKIGVPISIATLIVINIYLIICHVVFTWH